MVDELFDHLIYAVSKRHGVVKRDRWVGGVNSPEIIVVIPNRRPVWVVFGELTQQQIRQHNRMRKLGEIVEVVTSIQDIDKIFI